MSRYVEIDKKDSLYKVLKFMQNCTSSNMTYISTIRMFDGKLYATNGYAMGVYELSDEEAEQLDGITEFVFRNGMVMEKVTRLDAPKFRDVTEGQYVNTHTIIPYKGASTWAYWAFYLGKEKFIVNPEYLRVMTPVVDMFNGFNLRTDRVCCRIFGERINLYIARLNDGSFCYD